MSGATEEPPVAVVLIISEPDGSRWRSILVIAPLKPKINPNCSVSRFSKRPPREFKGKNGLSCPLAGNGFHDLPRMILGCVHTRSSGRATACQLRLCPFGSRSHRRLARHRVAARRAGLGSAKVTGKQPPPPAGEGDSHRLGGEQQSLHPTFNKQFKHRRQRLQMAEALADCGSISKFTQVRQEARLDEAVL